MSPDGLSVERRALRMFQDLLLLSRIEQTSSMIIAAILFFQLAALPDRIITPGAVRTTDTYSVCHDYTWKYRHTTAGMKRKSYSDYGLKCAPKCGQQVEVDHLISLQLGGADVQENLWPQPYSPRPGAHEKDVLEGYLHRQVCSGKMSLAEAQHKIRTNWYKAYLEMLADKKRGK